MCFVFYKNDITRIQSLFDVDDTMIRDYQYLYLSKEYFTKVTDDTYSISHEIFIWHSEISLFDFMFKLIDMRRLYFQFAVNALQLGPNYVIPKCMGIFEQRQKKETNKKHSKTWPVWKF